MTPDWDDLVLVGRIARAQGNRGEVVVNSETDFPQDRFRAGAHFFINRARGVEVVTARAVRFHLGRPVLALAGVETISAAEELAGGELRIPADTLVPLPPGTFYRHELVGCRVRTGAGEAVGAVKAVEGSREGSRLIVDGPRGEILVPLADSICRVVDPRAGEIVIEPPDGLLEVNAPARAGRSARRR